MSGCVSAVGAFDLFLCVVIFLKVYLEEVGVFFARILAIIILLKKKKMRLGRSLIRHTLSIMFGDVFTSPPYRKLVKQSYIRQFMSHLRCS